MWRCEGTAQSPSLSLRNTEEVPLSQSYSRLELEGCVGVLQAEKGVDGVELYPCTGFGKLGFESGELQIPLKISLSCGPTDLKVLNDRHHVLSVGTAAFPSRWDRDRDRGDVPHLSPRASPFKQHSNIWSILISHLK